MSLSFYMADDGCTSLRTGVRWEEFYGRGVAAAYSSFLSMPRVLSCCSHTLQPMACGGGYRYHRDLIRHLSLARSVCISSGSRIPYFASPDAALLSHLCCIDRRPDDTMASLAVAASVAASASSLLGTRVSARTASASPVVKGAAVRCEAKNDAEIMQRRAVMAAAAASLVATMSGVALAQPTTEPKIPGEPKPGTKEARKIYRRICVTMPTAKICNY